MVTGRRKVGQVRVSIHHSYAVLSPFQCFVFFKTDCDESRIAMGEIDVSVHGLSDVFFYLGLLKIWLRILIEDGVLEG